MEQPKPPSGAAKRRPFGSAPGLRAAAAPALAAAALFSAAAFALAESGDWSNSGGLQGALDGMRSFSRRVADRPPRPAMCPLPVPGGEDSAAGDDCEAVFEPPVTAERKGPAPRRPQSEPEPDKSPLNTGFQALGPAGSGGSIDGPGRKGNGTFRVLKNEPYELVFQVQTGYMDGAFTLARSSGTGENSVGFSGRVWDHSRGDWGAPVEGSVPGLIRYDASRDRGDIRYTDQEGSKKKEGYWDGGKPGRTRMTIEFGGGYDHAFQRDQRAQRAR